MERCVCSSEVSVGSGGGSIANWMFLTQRHVSCQLLVKVMNRSSDVAELVNLTVIDVEIGAVVLYVDLIILETLLARSFSPPYILHCLHSLPL